MPVLAAVAFRAGVVRNHLDPQLRVGRELHAARQDADDDDRLAVDADRLAEDAGIGGVAVRPQAVAEDGDALRVLAAVLGREVAAEERLLAEQPEEIFGHPRARLLFRHRLVVGDVHRVLGERAHVGEGLGLRAPVEQLLVRHAAGPGDAVGPEQAGSDHVKTGGVVEGESADEDRVDQREDRGIHADAEGEREHCGGGEPPVLEDGADGRAQVLKHVGPDVCGGRESSDSPPPAKGLRG